MWRETTFALKNWEFRKIEFLNSHDSTYGIIFPFLKPSWANKIIDWIQNGGFNWLGSNQFGINRPPFSFDSQTMIDTLFAPISKAVWMSTVRATSVDKIPGYTDIFSVPVIPDGLEGALHYGNWQKRLLKYSERRDNYLIVLNSFVIRCCKTRQNQRCWYQCYMSRGKTTTTHIVPSPPCRECVHAASELLGWC